MKINAVIKDITRVDTDAIVVSVFESIKRPRGATAIVDKALNGAITSLIKRGVLNGKFGEIHIIHTFGRIPARIVAVAGLGKQEDFSVDRVRGIVGEFCRTLRKMHCQNIVTILHGTGVGDVEPETSAQAITEGAILGLYSFTKYKKPEYDDIKEILIVVREEESVSILERVISRGKLIAEAVSLARDMGNEPANYMTPSQMAEVAKEIANKHNLEIQIFDRLDMERMSMGALLGVSKGSNQPPKLIVLSYRGNKYSKKSIGFLGKGITFDSGGISIKPSEGMAEMKDDMAGAASVMAAIAAVAQLKPRINVTAVIPATENLPSGTALKPGDVLKAMNGKTIEVINTDAEGRLILADAMSYARKIGLSPLIDLATLTGACRVALGLLYSGLFGNDQDLTDRVLSVAQKTGEKMWQMPMPNEYKELIKSDIADIKNTGNKYGGAITAALFLAEFVDDTPWVHIDIAGPSFSNKESGYIVKGATAFGVRTLIELALSEVKSQEDT